MHIIWILQVESFNKQWLFSSCIHLSYEDPQRQPIACPTHAARFVVSSEFKVWTMFVLSCFYAVFSSMLYYCIKLKLNCLIIINVAGMQWTNLLKQALQRNQNLQITQVSIDVYPSHWYINGLMKERCNSIANALELHLSCTNPSIWCINGDYIKGNKLSTYSKINGTHICNKPYHYQNLPVWHNNMPSPHHLTIHSHNCN